MLLFLVLFRILLVLLQLEDQLQYFVAFRFGKISDVLTELEDIAAVIDHLLRALEIRVESAFLADTIPSIVVAVMEERRVSIELP